MSDGNAAAAPQLGVSRLIGETFSIFSKCFLPCVIAALVPGLVVAVIAVILVGTSALVGDPESIDPAAAGAGAAIVSLLSLIAGSLATAVIVRVVYDFKMGRPVDIQAALNAALPLLLPIIVLSIAAAIAIGIGFALLIVPGIWIAAALSVVMPAIVVEKAGFGALGRSFELTKGYRWPIALLLVVMFVILLAAGLLIALVTGIFASISPLIGVIVDTALNAVPQALFSVAPVLVYARLREIKDGIGIEDVANVFD